MNNRQRALILLIATALIILTVKHMPFNTRYYNVSAVETTGPFGIYWDKNCTKQVTSINWTTLTPGSAKNVTVYVKNLSNATCYLSVATTNWNPQIHPRT
jgi:hypothetical protein